MEKFGGRAEAVEDREEEFGVRFESGPVECGVKNRTGRNGRVSEEVGN